MPLRMPFMLCLLDRHVWQDGKCVTCGVAEGPEAENERLKADVQRLKAQNERLKAEMQTLYDNWTRTLRSWEAE